MDWLRRLIQQWLFDIGEIRAVALHTGDVVVLKCGNIKPEMATRLRKAVMKIWPDNKVVILADGIDISVVHYCDEPNIPQPKPVRCQHSV